MEGIIEELLSLHRFIFFTCDDERVPLKGKTTLEKEVFKECLKIFEGSMNGVKSVINGIKVAQDASGSRMGQVDQSYWWKIFGKNVTKQAECNEKTD